MTKSAREQVEDINAASEEIYAWLASEYPDNPVPEGSKGRMGMEALVIASLLRRVKALEDK